MIYRLKRLWCGLTVSHHYARSRRLPGFYVCRSCGQALQVSEVD
jgi:hypothetical protein